MEILSRGRSISFRKIGYELDIDTMTYREASQRNKNMYKINASASYIFAGKTQFW